MFFSNALLTQAHNLFTGKQLSLLTIFLSLCNFYLSLSVYTVSLSTQSLSMKALSLSLQTLFLSDTISLPAHLTHSDFALYTHYLFHSVQFLSIHTICTLSLSLSLSAH